MEDVLEKMINIDIKDEEDYDDETNKNKDKKSNNKINKIIASKINFF